MWGCGGREVNRLGLPGLYETILDTSGPELRCALQVGLLLCSEPSVRVFVYACFCACVLRDGSVHMSRRLCAHGYITGVLAVL